mmetsp:Transcript_39791/g.51298  ORF Transcript_39791/g.51298 Transcript_39791/m.51298 type:complete len:383 (+) Transcript_39791:24-1172(+)
MASGGGMNKMFAILPVYFLSTKLNWEDPNIVQTIRLGYFFEQAVLIFGCAYLYFKVKGMDDKTVISVKKAPSFAEPKPSWTKTTYVDHEFAEITALAQQLVMGLIMTTFLHFKMEIKQSILMQACMMPITFIDCKVVQRYFMGKGDNNERVYGEILQGEDIPKDEEVEEIETKEAEEVTTKNQTSSSSSSSSKSPSGNQSTLKRLIQGTWDSGKSAKYEPLLKILSSSNVNTKTDSDFTALMVVSAGVGDVTDSVQHILDLGADVTMSDDEGWTALHWATFHGNAYGVKALCNTSNASNLKDIKDADGNTALDLANNEKDTCERELKVLKNELNEENGNDSSVLSKQQISIKETQLQTKCDIVQVLLTSSQQNTTENLHEID